MGIYDMLYDWQKKIVDTYLNKQSYGIWLKCGLGKTPISLAFAEQLQCDKIIVVSINAKATEDINVKGSFLWWLDKSQTKYITYDKSNNLLLEANEKPNKHDAVLTNNPECYIINYEALYNRKQTSKKDKRLTLKDDLINFISNARGQRVALILDESHRIKDINSLACKSVYKIKELCEYLNIDLHCYLLSGTPWSAGFEDLYAQLKLLGCTWSKTMFLDTFCIRGHYPSLASWQQPIVGYKNIELLFELIHKYAITIETESVIKLPEQIFVDIEIPQSEYFKVFLSETMKTDAVLEICKNNNITLDSSVWDTSKKTMLNPFYSNLDYPNNRWIADTPSLMYLRSRQLSIGFMGNTEEYKYYDTSRLEKLKEFLQANEDNYILFYNFDAELFEVFMICQELGYNIDVYNGNIKSLKNYDYYEMHEETRLTNKKNIIISNYASGSTGKNWQLYNKIIMFSIPLYKDYEQSLARIHRNGQKETCVYYRFIGNNYIDKAMMKALNENKEYDQNMFNSDLKRIKKIMSV